MVCPNPNPNPNPNPAQANAAIHTLGSLDKWKAVPEEELRGNPAREELTEASSALLELTWPSDDPLKPVYAAATRYTLHPTGKTHFAGRVWPKARCTRGCEETARVSHLNTKY